MTELEQLAVKGLAFGAKRFLIASNKVPPWGVPGELFGRPLEVCETLMDCVKKAIVGDGWIVNPMPFEGLEILPSDNGNG